MVGIQAQTWGTSRLLVLRKAALIMVTPLLFAGLYLATVFDLEWKIPVDEPVMTIQVGDSVRFDWSAWSGYHDVVSSESAVDFDACRGSAELASPDSGSYTHTFSSSGTFYFICSIGLHCSYGQKVAINVQPESSELEPTGPELPGGDGNEGDQPARVVIKAGGVLAIGAGGSLVLGSSLQTSLA